MIELKSTDCTDVEEQETTITYGRKDTLAYVYCSDNTVLTKIQKLLNTEGSEWKLIRIIKNQEGNPTGYEFTVPKKMISLKAKKKAGRELTEEERKALGERLRGIRKASNSDADEPEEDED